METTLINRQVGDFVIEAHIGYSALSTLYRAVQLGMNRAVSLKILGLERATSDRALFLRYFMEQAGVLTQLEHIHILPIYAYGVVEDEFAYIANRLTERKLVHLLRQRLPSLAKTVSILSQIAAGLDYAAERGVIHGSIVPGNVYLDQHDNAFIDDYEMSRIAQAVSTQDELLRILGTPAYAPPEQLRLQPLDRRADIYSLGAIAYRMAVGMAPFEMTNGGMAELVQMHEQKMMLTPHLLRPDLPPGLEEVILKAMHEDPAQRFETATAFVKALEAAARQPRHSRQEGIVPASGASRETTLAQSVTLPLWVVAIGAILLVLLLVALLLVSRG